MGFRSKEFKGLTILGCEAGSGKTVLMTGLAASLSEGGYDIKAIKPVCLNTQSFAEPELDFISQITRHPLDYKVNYLACPGMLSQTAWQDAVSLSHSDSQIKFVELPGSPATPLTWSNDKTIFWQDVANLAAQIAFPAILVAKYSLKCIEQLIVNTAYLKRKQIPIVGIVLMRTSLEIESVNFFPEPLDLALAERTSVPFLGTIPYSPSISVSHVRQGNLIKLVSQSLDMLPIVDAIGLPLASLPTESFLPSTI